jgi:hypothetical protein
MIRTCQHCGELILGDAYRVTSEEDGVPLLNMVVCYPCAMEAKRLQLHTEPINPGVQYPSIQNGKSPANRRDEKTTNLSINSITETEQQVSDP